MRHLCGRVGYWQDGIPAGREHWHWTETDDGRETVRAVCEIDEGQILRDVLYTVDSNGIPSEAFVRLQAEGCWAGSSSYVVRGNEMEVTTWKPGPQSAWTDWVPVPERFVLITHPVFLDGWQVRAADRSVREPQRIPAFNCSTRPDGGDLVLRYHETVITILGTEEAAAPGGVRRVLHFQIRGPSDLGPIDVWLDEAQNTLVAAEWKGYDGWYELEWMSASAKGTGCQWGELDTESSQAK